MVTILLFLFLAITAVCGIAFYSFYNKIKSTKQEISNLRMKQIRLDRDYEDIVKLFWGLEAQMSDDIDSVTEEVNVALDDRIGAVSIKMEVEKGRQKWINENPPKFLPQDQIVYNFGGLRLGIYIVLGSTVDVHLGLPYRTYQLCEMKDKLVEFEMSEAELRDFVKIN